MPTEEYRGTIHQFCDTKLSDKSRFFNCGCGAQILQLVPDHIVAMTPYEWQALSEPDPEFAQVSIPSVLPEIITND